jgi:hypothetical protein
LRASEWAYELEVARQPGRHMGAIHLLALAHVLRRPIIVYGEPTVGLDFQKQGINQHFVLSQIIW